LVNFSTAFCFQDLNLMLLVAKTVSKYEMWVDKLDITPSFDTILN